MKKFFLTLAMCVVGLGLTVSDADAKRLAVASRRGCSGKQ